MWDHFRRVSSALGAGFLPAVCAVVFLVAPLHAGHGRIAWCRGAHSEVEWFFLGWTRCPPRALIDPVTRAPRPVTWEEAHAHCARNGWWIMFPRAADGVVRNGPEWRFYDGGGDFSTGGEALRLHPGPDAIASNFRPTGTPLHLGLGMDPEELRQRIAVCQTRWDIAVFIGDAFDSPPGGGDAFDVRTYFVCSGWEKDGEVAFSHAAVVSDHQIIDCPVFIRGDTNGDGRVDVADAVRLLNYLFAEGELKCLDAGDVQNDGHIDVGDATLLLSYLFNAVEGVAPAFPFPDPGPDNWDPIRGIYSGAEDRLQHPRDPCAAGDWPAPFHRRPGMPIETCR